MKKKESTAAQEAPAVEFRQPPQSSLAPPPVSQITQPYSDLWRVDFVVWGPPVPQPRASHGRGGRKYYPSKILNHRRSILCAFLDATRATNSGAPYFEPSPTLALVMDCEFIFPLDVKKRWGKDKKQLASIGKLPATSRLLGDWDNLAKMVQDALNGYAYADDQFVVGTRHTVKRYQRADDPTDIPRTIVRIEVVV